MASKNMSRTEILRRIMKLREQVKKTYDALPENPIDADLASIAETLEATLVELGLIENKI